MSEASIKGVAIQPVVQLAHELLESGRISREQLEARLEPPDLHLLDEKVEPFPETTRHATEGFIEILATELTGRGAVASSQRPAPSHIIFEGCVEA